MSKIRGKSGLIASGLIAANKKARYNYELEDPIEAGIMLTGTEVKSLRLGQANIVKSHIGQKDGALYLIGANIPPYLQAGAHLQHDPTRMRKLLLNKRQLGKMMGSITRDGYTILPLRLYFNERGVAKISIALGRGKKLHDKRQVEKKRDWDRQKSKIMKDNG